ncbi:MAG: response regulator transcription factor [Bacteroidetes bacterium]|nr:response regulator transcription factor [Bacteroidota bacterium]
MKKILLVEDEESLINVLTLNLELENYEVDVATTGKNALTRFNDSYHLVILDVMLPEISGFDVCREIRKTSHVPILFISAKGTSADRINGLKLGADDYLVKPFNLEELLLRVAILIDRQKSEMLPDVYYFDGHEVNFKTFEIKANGQLHTVSKREMELLKLLISKKGEVVSRDLILDTIWGKEQFPTSRTIDNYILSLRKYFEKDNRNPQYFKSLRGVGYKFETKS